MLDDPAVRLLTLTGPGGVGKTRLAIEVAQRMAPDFVDGVRFVALEAIRDPDLALPTVAAAFGVQERGTHHLVELLQTELQDRHLLLVLDNFEQLLQPAPLWLTHLLSRCPRITALITSRTALNVDGEHRYEVPLLPISEPNAAPDAPVPTAVRLFAERARAIQPAFVLDETNRETVTEICQRLDGLPLAIELAAARIGALTPAEILTRLADRFALLKSGRRDAAPRLRSMRDAVAWSHDLLTEEEQTLFRRLAVFVGGFTLAATEAVCGRDARSGESVLTELSALIDHSLVRRVAVDRGAGRYRMLETIREFAAERLAASGEVPALRDRHARWVLELARGTRAGTTLQQALTIDRLVVEQPNIEAALHWLLESDQGEALVDLVTTLEFYWMFSRPPVEGLTWHQRALSYRNASPGKRIDLLNVAAPLAHWIESPLADVYIEELRSLVEHVGSPQQRANAAFIRALRAEDHANYPQAEMDFKVARTLSVQAGDIWQGIQCDYHLGVVAYGQGRLERSVEILEAAQAAAVAIGDPFTPAWCLVYLTFIACERGDTEGAVALLSQHPDVNRSADLQQERLDHEHESMVRAAAGVVACALDRYQLAARLLGSAVNEAELCYPEQIIAGHCLDSARRALGDDEFYSLWNAGYRMRPEEVQVDFEHLLAEGRGKLEPDVPVASPPHGLSSRELEVVRLLADGMNNKEIANALFVSPRTINSHLDHILTKLDVRSRTAAVAFAIRNGLA
jgi:predicted ATPase/DNA-binding CsgD family transcriptional regulator